MSDVIISPSGEELSSKVPPVKAVHPFGSKILVEVLEAKETMQTNLHLPESSTDSGAPQAYIVELGPSVDESLNLRAGQRVFWTGKGTHVNDPRSSGRTRAFLEVHNIIGVIEEESASCSTSKVG